MPDIDRRKLLQTGVAFAVPLGGLSLLSGCQPAADSAKNDGSPEAKSGEANSPEAQSSESETDLAETRETQEPVVETEENSKGKNMQVHYLEIVTPEVDALCKLYSTAHGVTFGEADPSLGNARTAKLDNGGVIGIRAPLREDETPVIRPYMLVEDVEAAVAAAGKSGAEIALPKMEIPGHGTIGIVIQGGIECGFWQI